MRMKQRLLILLGLIVLVIVLIAMNAASYTQRERMPDAEVFPNRSTFNGGATGTKAYFDLLAETGRKPFRWTRQPADLGVGKPGSPDTLIIVGSMRQPVQKAEAADILRWVGEGGRLVLIDRSPPEFFTSVFADWSITFKAGEKPFLDADAYDQKQMTFSVDAARPVQPTLLTAGVNAVQPSRYAATIEIEAAGNPAEENVNPVFGSAEPRSELATLAPVVHFKGRGAVVADISHGGGQIVFVSDPYLVTNTGISVADNAQFAVNLATAAGGTVAFDEYHQGYGENNNRLLNYFAGTPVIGIFLQICLLVGLVFYSQSRRFARPVPEPEPSRISKLEYVSAMAELQQRTKGYDLAIENIYSDFRRRVSRLVGVDNASSRRRDLAVLISERLSDENPEELEILMESCESAMHGGPVSRKEVVRLTTRIRELETKLGLLRRRKTRG